MKVDVTPGAHSWLDALAEVSFTLACGCRRPPSQPDRARDMKIVGCLYECSKHGDQVITRSTMRLVGWQ